MSGKVLLGGSRSEQFVARRRRRKRRALLALGLLILITLGMLLWGLHQSAVRISRVEIYGADQSLATIASEQMQGSYLGIIPRNSMFFFPSQSIRSEILDTHLDIAAISLFRSGLTSLSIKVNYRVPIARWCGLTPSASSGQASLPSVVSTTEHCYVFDASGFIFAATSTRAINTFTLYAPLEGETAEPLGATIAHAEKLPAIFDFARQLTTFSSSVSYIVSRDDEVDLYLVYPIRDDVSNGVNGTRITYVLGDEENAFTALMSARTNLNLADGSIEYIDLRFGGKVYLKKATVSQQ